ncbi:Tetratricopeptide repeat-containing protein [Fibrobacter sp. UWOV1]|uniref:tetratricopeptide repeat protein n=1 Tax=Fibrobacter sp. UWOV1 TaxID=1896215 RepID=UPI000922C6F0|nr:tetratricopeptide repeat protein [Fibrobacter sp. UWOV1]SHL06299.1 Tetratricopeptide repeat-containing protein [Fibrobacter sp. UWOV1]
MLRRVCYIGVLLFTLSLMSCVNDDIKRGNDALRIGDYERAIANFSKALDVEPANRDARYGLALSYYADAEQADRFNDSSFVRWSRAAREFKILYGLDSSGSIDANYSTCLFYLARATLGHDASANVLPLLNKSIDLDSLNYFSYNLKGLILSRSNVPGDQNSAKNIFIHIVTREPGFISAYINLGNIYWEEGDVESAWDTWSAGLQKAPTNSSLIYWTQVAEDSLKSMVLSGRL